jgi:hypothetical protein
MPCNISRQALYHIINLGFANTPVTSIPHKLIHDQYTGPVVEIKEYCNRVVHPVTKETITHYRKLIKDPLLRDLWLNAMNKELQCLVQRYIEVTIVGEVRPRCPCPCSNTSVVGRPSTGARGSKKLVLLAFLLSICHSQNYEEKHGEMMM